MLDNREKKNLLIVILAILCLIGVFVGVRSCTKTEENKLIEEDLTEKPEKPEKPEVEVEEEKPSKPVKPSRPETSVPENNKKPEVPAVPGTDSNTNNKDEIVYKDPVVTMKEKYSVEYNKPITLPTVTVDDNGEKVTTEVSYEFLEIGNTQYIKALGVDTTKIGTYKVTYRISNGHKAITKVIYVDVVDNVAPVVNANKKEYNDQEEINVPVLENVPAKGPIYVTFTDNDEVVYATYYKAKYEFINGEETIEKEGMQEVIEINPNEPFIIADDGEYHVRITDRSENTTEFVIIHDETPANEVETKVTETEVYGDVTVTFDEEMQAIEGWTLSKDKKSLTKSYDKETTEDVIFKDLAGNESVVNIHVFVIDTKPAKVVGKPKITETDLYADYTIVFNEEMQAIEGWTLSEDKKSLTKSYDKPTKETVIFKDLAGNETSVNVVAYRVLTVLLNGEFIKNNQKTTSKLGDDMKIEIHTDKKGKFYLSVNNSKKEPVEVNEGVKIIDLKTGSYSNFEIKFKDSTGIEYNLNFLDNESLNSD